MTRLANSIVAGDVSIKIPPLYERLLTIQQVCAWLNIGPTTLHKLRKACLLLPVPIENRVLYDPEDVRAYIARAKELGRCSIFPN